VNTFLRMWSETANDDPAARAVATWRVYFLQKGLEAHRAKSNVFCPDWRAKERDYLSRLLRAERELARWQNGRPCQGLARTR
jgi:hypothetical protein